MKIYLLILLAFTCVVSQSCAVGNGCPTNGKNIGAERVLSGDAKTMKAIKKARKFKA